VPPDRTIDYGQELYILDAETGEEIWRTELFDKYNDSSYRKITSCRRIISASLCEIIINFFPDKLWKDFRIF